MNIIANNVASKLFVAFVAASMLFTLATPAKAATVEELQAMIAQLTAQIAALSGGSAAPAAGACTFTRALTVGSEGADVKCLQDYLTPTYFTNAGGSTGYFGPVTAAAVAAWQTANGVTPAAGYFGTVSQAKYNALMAAAGPVTGGGSTPADDEDDDMGGLSGEASWTNFEIDSASDDEVDEGSEDAEIATATFEFEDGDAMITRIDVAIDGVADAWDVLDEVSLWVDGDEIARTDASDEDEYQDEDTGTLRFSGLDLVAAEDEEVEVMIAATFQNTVDSADQGTYNVSVDTFRWVDADDVTSTEDGSEFELGDNVTFTLGEAGQDDEVIVKTSTEDPDGTTLEVKDDSKSDWYTIFAFDIDTDDSENDIDLNEVSVIVDTASSSGSAADLLYADLVDDVELVIDGVTIDKLVTTGGTATGTAAGYDESRVLRFDVDGDVTVGAGDRVTAELRAKFKSLAAANEGATVRGRVSSENAKAIDAEGSDDIPAARLSGSATGDQHTLRTEGIVLTLDSITETEKTKTISNTSFDYGVYVFTFTVEAFNGEFYMDEDSAIVDFDLLVDGVAADSASTTATLDIAGAEDASVADKVINEGEEATFTLTVETTTSVDGSAKVVVNSVAYSAADDATEELTAIATPDDEWTSESLIIN